MVTTLNKLFYDLIMTAMLIACKLLAVGIARRSPSRTRAVARLPPGGFYGWVLGIGGGAPRRQTQTVIYLETNIYILRTGFQEEVH